MSIATQQVTKAQTAKAIDSALPVKTKTRGVAGNHTMLKGHSLQRKCSCGGQCPKCNKQDQAKSGLAMSQADDYSEREAESVAHELTRNPANSLGRRISRKSAPAAKVSPKVSDSESDTENGAASLQESEVSSETEAQLRNAVGNGRPLPGPLRDFFETRLNHDFSQVRIHTDHTAAETSQSLNAAAFTFGSDVFFNAGLFNPHTASGVGLIAHELTHVAQQPGDSVSRQLIQRDKLPYRQLTWGNFTGAVPQTVTDEGAGIWSSFGIPSSVNFKPSVTDTKKRCTVKNPEKGQPKTDTYWEGTVQIDLTQFDTDFQPFMDTAQSWALPKLKDNGASYCAGEVATCERMFDQNPRSRPTLGSATATSKADCRRGFQTTCLANRKKESDRVLSHEQWHFEITRVIAEKARASFKTAAAAINPTSRECGPKAAMDKLENDLVQPRADLIAQGQIWLTLKNTVQDEYDAKTTHGGNAAKQHDWEILIQGGLVGYGVTAGAVVTPATTTTPPPNPPATPAPTTQPTRPAPTRPPTR